MNPILPAEPPVQLPHNCLEPCLLTGFCLTPRLKNILGFVTLDLMKYGATGLPV